MRKTLGKVKWAVGGLLLIALLPGTAAAAQSTTMYPGGDVVSLSSAPITIEGPNFKPTGCTTTGGSFVVPSSRNPSGPVTATLKTLPTFNCVEKMGVDKGVWQISVEYGTGVVTLKIPPEGLLFKAPVAKGHECPAEECWFNQTLNGAAGALVGGPWNNGFRSPVVVSSAANFGGSLAVWHNKNPFEGGFEGSETLTFKSTGLITLTDTTHPESVPLVGP